MTKVLEILGEPFLSGGEESFLINVFRHIDADNIHIDFFTPYNVGNDFYKKIIEDRSSKIYSAGLPFVPGGLMLNVIKPIDNILKSNHYDVVHINSGRISALALSAYISKKNKIKKIIVHSHSAGEKNSIKHTAVKLAMLPFTELCPTDYYACSEAAGKWKYSKYICKNKLVIIKNGVDLNTFCIDEEKRKEYRQKLGYSDTDLVIGHVGRFTDEKNHCFILELFAELRTISKKHRLILIGDGELREEIQKQAEELAIRDSITFTGNVNNVSDYMQAMDLFILPSKFEGLGIAGIEAQACGLPVITSTGVPHDIKLTDNVAFLPLYDKSKWIDTISKMILLPKMNNAQIIRSKGYDINSTAEILRKVYSGD